MGAPCSLRQVAREAAPILRAMADDYYRRNPEVERPAALAAPVPSVQEGEKQ